MAVPAGDVPAERDLAGVVRKAPEGVAVDEDGVLQRHFDFD